MPYDASVNANCDGWNAADEASGHAGADHLPGRLDVVAYFAHWFRSGIVSGPPKTEEGAGGMVSPRPPVSFL
jgi:hypothetical protein